MSCTNGLRTKKGRLFTLLLCLLLIQRRNKERLDSHSTYGRMYAFTRPSCYLLNVRRKQQILAT